MEMNTQLLPSYEKLQIIKQNLPGTVRSIHALVCFCVHHQIITPDVDLLAVNDLISFLTFLQEGE